MDLMSIVQVIWRHKRLSLPVLLLTFLAMGYVLKVEPPVYKASSSVLLTNPPSKATASQIAKDPSLKNADPYNTFASYGSLQVVANAVIDLINSPASQPTLLQAGAGTGYKIQLSTDYGNPPIIDITGVGSTPQAAVISAKALTTAVGKDLISIQESDGINPFYMIKSKNIVKPTQASSSSSSKLRSLVVVFGAGIILLFIFVSGADAMEKRRSNSMNRGRTRRTPRFEPDAARQEHLGTSAQWQPGGEEAVQEQRGYSAAPRYPRV